MQVILIEPNAVFTSCPFSNEVIAGLREIEAQQFGYDKLAAEGVTVIGAGRDHNRAAAAQRHDGRRRRAAL